MQPLLNAWSTFNNILKNYPQGVIHQKNMYIINTLNNKVLFKYKKNHIFFLLYLGNKIKLYIILSEIILLYFIFLVAC